MVNFSDNSVFIFLERVTLFIMPFENLGLFKGKLEENLEGHRNSLCQVCIVRMVAMTMCSFELF